MNIVGNDSGAGETLTTYPIKMYELREDFKDQPDEFYVNGAQKAANAARFAEAGAFVRTIKDKSTREKTFHAVVDILEHLNKVKPSTAYDGMHQFIDNFENAKR